MKIVVELLKHNANPNRWDLKKEYMPLHCAAAVGCVDIVKYLIMSGADINAGFSDSRSPLHYAVLNNATNCVAALLQEGACIKPKVLFYHETQT